MNRWVSFLTALMILAAGGWVVQRHFAGQDRQIAKAVKAVAAEQVLGCRRGNDLRGTLRSLTRRQVSSIRQFEREGTLTQAQAQRSLDQVNRALFALRDRNCVAVKRRVTPTN